MAEEPDVQVADITPDDFDGEQEAPTESSPVENVKEEAKAESKTEPEKAEEGNEEVKTPEVPTKEEGEAESTEEALAEEPEGKPQGKAEERKTQLNSEIRDLVAQRNALKSEVEKANAEVYQPATEIELEEQGMSSLEAKVESMRQQQEMEKFNSQVADVQLTISSEAEKVLHDFPIFNAESNDYDKELAEEAAELLRANLILDPNTQQIIGSNVSPYKLYKAIAKASNISATKGQLKGQQATEQMLANADSPTSAAPPAKVKDPLADIWAEPL